MEKGRKNVERESRKREGGRGKKTAKGDRIQRHKNVKVTERKTPIEICSSLKVYEFALRGFAFMQFMNIHCNLIAVDLFYKVDSSGLCQWQRG